MYFSAKSLDDLMRRVLERLLRSKNKVKPTRGDNAEETGVLLKLANPRVRLSRTEAKGTVFSALGELLWYLSGSQNLDFIKYYINAYENDSEDGTTVYGGYGPRLFRLERGQKQINQIENVIRLLSKHPDSRRAVVQLFDGEDIEGSRRKEVPCTCTLQFLLRKGCLHLFANMRSNDAYLGLPHDVFAFTMLQEIVARRIGVEIGHYKHFVGSLHLYDKHVASAERFLKEGWQEVMSMPAMPLGDPQLAIKELLACEEALRKGTRFPKRVHTKQDYWADLVRLLEVYRHTQAENPNLARRVRSQMSCKYFNFYIQKRLRRVGPPTPEQLAFDLRLKK